LIETEREMKVLPEKKQLELPRFLNKQPLILSKLKKQSLNWNQPLHINNQEKPD
jgi:hypothetical protein